MVDAVEQCGACRQALWSEVRYCPFCGVQAAADATDDAARPAEAEATAVPPPLPPAAPAPAAPTPAAPEAVSKAAMQAAFRKAAAEEAERSKVEPEKGKPPVQGQKKPRQPKPRDMAADKKPESQPEGRTAAPAAPAAQPRPPSIAGKKILLGASLACVLVYWFWNPTPSGPDACDQSLAQAQSAMQQQNAQQAREHSQAALGACQDKQRARLAKTTDDGAQALLKTQAQAQARAEQQSRQQAAQQQSMQRIACEGSNRLTANLLRTARLDSARQNLQRMDASCHQMGDTQALSAQLDGMQATANKATADASAQLADGALGQARTSIDLLASTNRESSELPELRTALNKAQAVQAPAEVASRPAAVPPVQTELLRSFIRDAEASMQQRLYDKAKTYAESAQRIDPRNPEVSRLLRRIKEHEMSYLRDRIVIE